MPCNVCVQYVYPSAWHDTTSTASGQTLYVCEKSKT